MAINPNFIKASIAIGLLEGSTCEPTNFKIKPNVSLKGLDVDVRCFDHKKSKGDKKRDKAERSRKWGI